MKTNDSLLKIILINYIDIIPLQRGIHNVDKKMHSVMHAIYYEVLEVQPELNVRH